MAAVPRRARPRRAPRRRHGVGQDAADDRTQQVKNPSSQGARAVRGLDARHRVALTGTPVENRLSELWSVLDFTNPGLLGPFTRFKERYAIPVERWRDPVATERLRRLTAPFVLRRAKSDPGVAADLPTKHEIEVNGTLTREQATLYQAAIDTILDDEGLGAGIERRGRVLKLLMALKQICNPPAQYLQEGGALTGRSGKLDRTTEMLAEIADAGHRALLFTQFRGMGDLLARHLGRALGVAEVPFLHGGVAQRARDAMVERFQTEHRIGQDRPVTVQKLVTAGTVEERIAALLDDKRALADAVVGEGEAWLTELSNEELRSLIALSGSDLPDERADREPVG